MPRSILSFEESLNLLSSGFEFGNWETWQPAFFFGPVSYEITDNVQPLSVTPNDPLFGLQWHLKGANGIDVQKVWDDYRGAGITLGFIDDGIQFTHPDIDG